MDLNLDWELLYENLPDDMILEIYSYLDPELLKKVCKDRQHVLCTDGTSLRLMFKLRYPSLEYLDIREINNLEDYYVWAMAFDEEGYVPFDPFNVHEHEINRFKYQKLEEYIRDNGLEDASTFFISYLDLGRYGEALELLYDYPYFAQDYIDGYYANKILEDAYIDLFPYISGEAGVPFFKHLDDDKFRHLINGSRQEDYKEVWTKSLNEGEYTREERNRIDRLFGEEENRTCSIM